MHNKSVARQIIFCLQNAFLFIVLMRISFDSVHSALLKQYPK